jgi:hypothetical protein
VRAGARVRQAPLMADTTENTVTAETSGPWESITVADLRPGDRVKLRGEFEFDVARIDAPFLGMDSMVCIIEDTPTRWHAYAAPLVEPVQARRGG